MILSAVRTPQGSFMGSLASVKASELGATAVKAALERASKSFFVSSLISHYSEVAPEQVNEVLLGNVLQAGQGQAPARQAALGAGLPTKVCCTTVNKVCASGMKTVMFGAQSIRLGENSVVVAGGFESMSNVPFYLDGRYGDRVELVLTWLQGSQRSPLWWRKDHRWYPQRWSLGCLQ